MFQANIGNFANNGNLYKTKSYEKHHVITISLNLNLRTSKVINLFMYTRNVYNGALVTIKLYIYNI